MKSRLALRRLALVFALAVAATSAPLTARALVWPDVPERVERDLASTDIDTRRLAARELLSLGKGRAEPLILRALEDTDLEVRLLAARAAIARRLPEATELLLAWLGERDPRARLAACEIAKVAPSPRAVPQLARALGDADAQVRGAAADALGAQGSPDAVAPLLGKLDDPSPPARVQIAHALARLGDRRAVVPLVGKVQDSVPEVRQAVARGLGLLGDPRAVQALVIALRDVNDGVRIEALGALGALRADAAVNAIASLLPSRTTALRTAAFEALGRIGSPTAIAALVAQLGVGDDAAITLERTAVRDALVVAAAGGASTTEAVLLPLLERASGPAVATSAAVVLGELRAKTSERALHAALRRGTVPLASALRALAGCGTSASIPVVLEFIDDENPLARGEAIATAALLLDPDRPDGRAVEPLAAALRGGRLQPAERVAVVQLLGRTGAPRAAPVLLPMVDGKDTPLRVAALDALASVGPAAATARLPGGKTAEVALVEALDDRSPEVRAHAGLAMARVGGDPGRELLLARLEGSAETDRFAVFHALAGILERAPSEPAVARLERALELAAGPERDALLDVLARAPVASATAVVIAQTRPGRPPDDRRAAVAALALRARTSPSARAAVIAGLADPSQDVRAEAAWAVGSLGDGAHLAALGALAASPHSDAATNATAALGRIAASDKGSAARAAPLLCARLDDARAYVRANALTGLALAGLTCRDAARARKLLATDPDEDAREAAARTLAGARGADERAALERCASEERSGAVAARCRESLGASPSADAARPTASGGKPAAVTVYVGQTGSTTPRPLAAFVLKYSAGWLRAGLADRRGALLDPATTPGWLELRRPSTSSTWAR
ncbi:MAG: HEAT repeat domain-containing protein [Myxococcales bacterium]|nr:HEAT repeat domain-containing protein [Myxococcales bacterium]